MKEHAQVPRVLHGYAEGRDGEWEAICLDLDIAVQGTSFEEVFRSLNDAVSLYLESVGDLPEGERTDLLDRPAPLSVRFRFLVHVVRSLLGERTETGYRHHFTMPCAA